MSIIFQLGVVGGADAKLFIVLSIIFPIYPRLEAFGHQFPLNKPLIDFFAFNVFDNTIILAMVMPIGLAIYNIAKIGLPLDNPLYIFIGYKAKISVLPIKHVKMIQNFEEVNGNIKFSFKKGGVEINDDIIRELRSLAEKGLIKDEIWVTPGIPTMIPITIGFFAAVFYGDLIFELTKYLISG